MRAVLTPGLGLALLAGATVAHAQDEPYLDDRSTPQALVKSLYNAVSRKEFARAWSYFSTPPAADLAAYEKGYARTEGVSVVVGTPAQEGAAGSTIYTLPVAIGATEGGEEKVFAGCYTLRLANPQIQAEDFKPLSIEKGALAPAAAPLDAALPTSCPDAQLPPQNAKVERARAAFIAGRGAECRLAASENAEPEVHELAYKYSFDAEADLQRKALLIRFICDRGAYNERYAYYLAPDDDAIKPLQFAMPELDIRYQGDDDTKLESMNVIGFNAASELVNPEYDPQTHTLRSQSLCRGMGDASSIGHWIFRNGDFALVKFEVDPTYDGNVEHQTVVDYDTGP